MSHATTAQSGLSALRPSAGEPPSPHRRLASPAGVVGPHMTFWDFCYDAAASISAWALPALEPALKPVNGDFSWQIAERNSVNYDMFHAWAASALMSGTFNPAKLKTQ